MTVTLLFWFFMLRFKINLTIQNRQFWRKQWKRAIFESRPIHQFEKKVFYDTRLLQNVCVPHVQTLLLWVSWNCFIKYSPFPRLACYQTLCLNYYMGKNPPTFIRGTLRIPLKIEKVCTLYSRCCMWES